MQNDASNSSPVLEALWRGVFSHDQFAACLDKGPSEQSVPVSAKINHVMDRVLEIVRARRDAKTLYDADSKLSEELIGELAAVGYWGLLVPEEFGGSGATFAQMAQFLTRVAMIDSTTAGIAAVHSFIGPVNQLVNFGNDEQKARLLPPLASGERIGVFGLTEPNAGSDLTALRTIAVRDGDDYIVNGEKLFITNLTYGRTIGLVCLIDKVPSVLIVELPHAATPEFELKSYGLHSLQHTSNNGAIFRNFRVPVANRLVPSRGDGLTIAYHGLNRGRVGLCANAAGTLRVMLANLLPWSGFRKTYGSQIASRQLVLRRIGRLAALIVGCDSLVAWASSLISSGQRGEIEAIIAKTFAAEALKEAAIELVMKTHGGRAFLKGHMFGDHVHDYLAPGIYEGENEILQLGLFKALVKPRLKTLHESLADLSLSNSQISHPNLSNLATQSRVTEVCKSLVEHGKTIDQLIHRYGAELANQQILMRNVAEQVSHDVMLLVVASAMRQGRRDQELAFRVLDCGYNDNGGSARNLTHPTSNSLELSSSDAAAVELGEMIYNSAWPELDQIKPQEILQRYECSNLDMT